MAGKDVLCPVCGSVEARIIARDRFDRHNRYLRCRACGSGFSQLRVDDTDETSDIHTAAYYTPEREEFREVPAAEEYFLSRLLALKSSGRLLDVGCGRGRWLRYIKDRSELRVEGLEPSAEAADYARRERVLDMHTGDLASALYPDETFDVVYLRNVLEHMAAPRDMVHKIQRILKPGGVCAVHVPNDGSVTNALKRVFYRAGLIREFGSLFFPLHVNGFTPYSLDMLFHESGFDTVARETVSKVRRVYEFPFVTLDFLLLPAAVAEQLTGRGNLILGWYRRR